MWRRPTAWDQACERGRRHGRDGLLCGHVDAPMSMGDMEGRVVAAPLHGTCLYVTTVKDDGEGRLGGVVGAMAKGRRMGCPMIAIRTRDPPAY